MQSQSVKPQSTMTQPEILSGQPIDFQTSFQGYMEMYSDIVTVSEYLNAHQGWFCRCAQPMKTQPLGDTGYIIVVGHFGAFGYEVEPKMAVILHPPQDRLYLMHSVPVPDYSPVGYDVDYRAMMELKEVNAQTVETFQDKGYSKKWQSGLPSVITQVTWHLNLKVSVQFPKFIYRLPASLIRSTGDRLLNQIVRQVSPRLSYKVQEDFHSGHSLPLPPKSSRGLERILDTELDQDEEQSRMFKDRID